MRPDAIGPKPGTAQLAAAQALCACALVALSGCGSERDAAEPWAGSVDTTASGRVIVTNPSHPIERDTVRAVETLRVGSAGGPGPAMFGEIADVTLGPLGRVFVLEGQAAEVRVFSRTGTHVRTFGRPGEGPGELKRPLGLSFDEEGRLWVPDPGNARYTVFDSTGWFLRSRPRELGTVHPWLGSFDERGRLYDVALGFGTDRVIRFTPVRVDPATGRADSLSPLRYGPLPDNGPSQYLGYLSPRLTFAMDPDRGIWAAETDRYRVIHRTFGGDTVLAFHRPIKPAPVTEAEKDSILAALAPLPVDIVRSDIPDTKPPVARIHVNPDGRVLVRLMAHRDEEGPAFDLFDADGRWKARVRTGAPFEPMPPPEFRGDTLVGVTRDAVGVPYVVVARLEGGSQGRAR